MLAVRDIMIADPLVVAPECAVREAAAIMHERNINSLVVCTEGRVEGILTSRDVVRRVALEGPSDDTVATFMTPAPTTISAEKPLEFALEVMDQLHIRHLPVVDGPRLVGILSIRDLMRHRTQFLEDLVRRQTTELQERHAKLQQRDRNMRLHLELAGRIQKELLPAALPRLEPLSLAVAYHPLDHVSGDTYDFTELDGGQLGILIADARGHGVPAAFVTVMARMVFQAFGREGRSPARVLQTINDRLPQLILAEHFITMCYAVVDRTNLRMTWASAGHPPPLWFRHVTTDVEQLEARGDLIGVLAEPAFEERTVQLRHHDTVLFYTDGLVEARNDRHEQFGVARTAAVLARRPEADGAAVLAELQGELHQFRGPGSYDDDLTCVALHIE
ncbi:MAG: PP2C family protein-serine/threonine phosphatase [Planctomycetota bacterium]